MSNYSRYKSRRSYSSDTSWWTIIICAVLTLFIMIGYNACTGPEWNDGYCHKCDVRYELRGYYNGIRYYACPNCGNEVSRYGGK